MPCSDEALRLPAGVDRAHRDALEHRVSGVAGPHEHDRQVARGRLARVVALAPPVDLGRLRLAPLRQATKTCSPREVGGFLQVEERQVFLG